MSNSLKPNSWTHSLQIHCNGSTEPRSHSPMGPAWKLRPYIYIYIYIYMNPKPSINPFKKIKINHQLKNVQSLKLFVQLFLKTFVKKNWNGNIGNISSTNCKSQYIFFFPGCENLMSTSIKFAECNNKLKLEDISNNL